MASTFEQSYFLSLDTTFRGRVRVAMAKVATFVVGENQSSMSGAKGTKRHNLGVAVLNDPDGYIERFVLATVTNAAIVGNQTDQADSSDGDIEFQVTSVFDDIAGVKNDE